MSREDGGPFHSGTACAGATGLEGAGHKCRSQGSGCLGGREPTKIREGQMRWGFVGLMKELASFLRVVGSHYRV